jgi:hypothetical protein
MKTALLTRDQFREAVFARDNHTCVFCTKPAVDAHHIIERRLWEDGGYYLNNGASVCEDHHIQCEMTLISVEAVRAACGITKVMLPGHMYDDQEYDKWGNIVLDPTRRVKGELFQDESVQKILAKAGVLDQFIPYVKYPRTYHLPWSPGMKDDDRMHRDVSVFDGQIVIATEKMDGENTTMYSDYIHARSIDSRNHMSRNRVKAFHGQICGDIPQGWRVCAENMFAKHSILYRNLASYVYGFSIWDEMNRILTWKDSLVWFDLFGMTHVPVLYHGVYDKDKIHAAWKDAAKDHESEGYVIRIDQPFRYGEFRKFVGKYVRKDHVDSSSHWMHGKAIIPNILAEGVK